MNKSEDAKLGIVECAVSLGRTCTNVGGFIPSTDMTLGEFIKTFGPNGVRFTTTPRCIRKYIRTNIPGHRIEIEFDTSTNRFQYLNKEELPSPRWRDCADTLFTDEKGDVVE